MYSNYKRRLVLIWLLPWLIPIIGFITREVGEPILLWTIIFPIVFIFVGTLIMHISRRVFLGNLYAYELEFRLVYELDKRNETFGTYNLRLLTEALFYEGDFQKTIECCDKLLSSSVNLNERYEIIHKKILSLFMNKEYEAVLLQIQEQRRTFSEHIVQEDEMCYVFIEEYINGNYDGAIEAIQQNLLIKNIDALNYKKVFFYYLMLVAFEAKDDPKNVSECKKEILFADSLQKTYFANFNDNTIKN